MIRGRRGAGLMDAMVSIFLLGTAGIVFSASFPTGFSALAQSSEATKATAIAQKKIEEVRSLDYAKLTPDKAYNSLLIGGYIDTNPMASPFRFTSVDGVPGALREGTGELRITDKDDGTLLVEVSVTWRSLNDISRNVTITTLIADTSPWVKI